MERTGDECNRWWIGVDQVDEEPWTDSIRSSTKQSLSPATAALRIAHDIRNLLRRLWSTSADRSKPTDCLERVDPSLHQHARSKDPRPPAPGPAVDVYLLPRHDRALGCVEGDFEDRIVRRHLVVHDIDHPKPLPESRRRRFDVRGHAVRLRQIDARHQAEHMANPEGDEGIELPRELRRAPGQLTENTGGE
jgi:hypothetical protein